MRVKRGISGVDSVPKRGRCMSTISELGTGLESQRRVTRMKDKYFYQSYVQEFTAEGESIIKSEVFPFESVTDIKRIAMISEDNVGSTGLFVFVAIKPVLLDVEDLCPEYQDAMRKLFVSTLSLKERSVLWKGEYVAAGVKDLEQTGDIVESLEAQDDLLSNMTCEIPVFKGHVLQRCFPFPVNLHNFSKRAQEDILEDFRAGCFEHNLSPMDYSQRHSSCRYRVLHTYPSWAALLKNCYPSKIFRKSLYSVKEPAFTPALEEGCDVLSSVASINALEGDDLKPDFAVLAIDFTCNVFSKTTLIIGYTKNIVLLDLDIYIRKDEEAIFLGVGENSLRARFKKMMEQNQLSNVTESAPMDDPAAPNSVALPMYARKTTKCPWCDLSYCKGKDVKRQHMKTHHSDFLTQCDLCHVENLVYRQWDTVPGDDLEAHKAERHGDSGELCTRCYQRFADLTLHTGFTKKGLPSKIKSAGKCTAKLLPNYVMMSTPGIGTSILITFQDDSEVVDA